MWQKKIRKLRILVHSGFKSNFKAAKGNSRRDRQMTSTSGSSCQAERTNAGSTLLLVRPFVLRLCLGNFSYCRRSLKGARTSLELTQAQRVTCLRAHKQTAAVTNCALWLFRNLQQRHKPYATRTKIELHKNYLLLSSLQIKLSNDLKQVELPPDTGATARTHASERVLSSGPCWPEDMFSKTEIR